MLQKVGCTDEAVAKQLYAELAAPVLHLVGAAALHACRSVQPEHALFCWGSYTVHQHFVLLHSCLTGQRLKVRKAAL